MLKKEFNKKYSCEFCQKRFPTPSKLQRHQLVHSGEKPYLCFICLKGFTQRVHLNTHKKHAHPQTMLDNPPQLMLDGQPQLNIEGEDENDNIAVPEIDEEPPLAIVQTWADCNNSFYHWQYETFNLIFYSLYSWNLLNSINFFRTQNITVPFALIFQK